MAASSSELGRIAILQCQMRALFRIGIRLSRVGLAGWKVGAGGVLARGAKTLEGPGAGATRPVGFSRETLWWSPIV
jgi:hypothetical protein